MPHMIEDNAMFSVRQRPWHKLGVVLADYPNTADAITAAKLDFVVEKAPVYALSDKDPDRYIRIEGYQRTFRTDTGVTLGIVGSRFEVIQNDVMFRIGEEIAATTEIYWETAGALEGGKRVWALMKLNRNIYIGGEKLDPYFLLTMGHDGRYSLMMRCTPIRVVCNNTLTAAMPRSMHASGVVTVRHTQNFEQMIANAKQSLGLVQNYYNAFETFADNLINEAYTKAMFEDLLKSLVPITDDHTDRQISHRMSVREAILECSKAPDLDNIRFTKWGAYNAVADYADHHRPMRDSGNVDERRYTRTFEDTQLKDRALALLTSA